MAYRQKQSRALRRIRGRRNKEFWLIDPELVEYELIGIIKDGKMLFRDAQLREMSMRQAKLRVFTKDELETSSDEKLAKSLRRVAKVEKKPA